MAINIKQVMSFQLKVLRIAGFLEYLQQVVKLCKAFRNVEGSNESRFPAKVDAAFTPFNSAVAAVDSAYRQSRASDYTQQIADEDTRRDNLYKQLVNMVKMYMKFAFDAEKKEAAELLWNIIRKYNVDTAENYSEESVKLQQMLQELDTNYQAELRIKKLGLESLIAQLKAANEQVRTLMGYRNDERMYQVKAALTTARADADTEYHSFILALNAAAVMDESEYRYEELISQINELIKYYRLYVVPKKGSKSEDDGGDPEDGGSDSGASGSEASGNSSSSSSSSSDDDIPGGSNSSEVLMPTGGGPDDDGISD